MFGALFVFKKEGREKEPPDFAKSVSQRSREGSNGVKN
jgi:hypothetical protein